MVEIELKQKVRVADCPNTKCKNNSFYAFFDGKNTVLYCSKCATQFTIQPSTEEE